MHSRALAALLVLAAIPTSAAAAPRTITIDADGPAKTWQGTATQGFNMSFFDSHLANSCGTAINDYCDDTLVHFTSAVPYDDSNLNFEIGGFEHSDFDMRVYASDATGKVGDLLTTGDGDGSGPLNPAISSGPGEVETASTFAEPDSYFLVRVVYFLVPGDEVYSGKLSWTGGFLSPDEE
jgi:hypothetical protein